MTNSPPTAAGRTALLAKNTEEHSRLVLDELARAETDRVSLASALLRSADLPMSQLISRARQVQQENATLWGQLEAVRGRDGMAHDRELTEVRAALTDALQAEHKRRADERIMGGPADYAAGFAEAVMPIVVRLITQRDGARLLAGYPPPDRVKAARADDLAGRWLASEDAAVRAAGIELREELAAADAADQAPPQPGPLAAIEVREPCPYCPRAPHISRRTLRRHIDTRHATVVAARDAGLLDAYVETAAQDDTAQQEQTEVPR